MINAALSEVVTNQVLVIPVSSWLIAQLMKVLRVLLDKKQLDFRYFTSSGGMPSAHSAFVTALATSVAFIEGLDSVAFGIAVVFALVIMYDAAGIRQSVGQQAAVLNRILHELGERRPVKLLGSEFKELVGHTPFQVLIGGLLGIIVAFVWFAFTGI